MSLGQTLPKLFHVGKQTLSLIAVDLDSCWSPKSPLAHYHFPEPLNHPGGYIANSLLPVQEINPKETELVGMFLITIPESHQWF